MRTHHLKKTPYSHWTKTFLLLTADIFYGQPPYYQQKMTFQLLHGIKVHVKYTEHLQCAFKYQSSKIAKISGADA